ncbi:MAG: OmpA family protein [Bradyrhizobiaceae bacterium]|nr:OmpA family protein [Bradyrhizobiaceae bacterium]
MRKALGMLCLVMLCSVSTVFSQGTTLFRDTFDDNDNGWWTGETDDGVFSAEVEDGHYVLSNTSEDSFRFTYQSIELPRDENFVVRLRMRVVEGEKESLAGVLYNAEDASNFYAFVTSGSEKGAMFRFKEAKINWIREFRELKDFTHADEWNTYEIRRQNDALACFVNDKFVGEYSYSYFKIFGEGLGIYLEGKTTVEVDEIEVTTSEMSPIDLAEGIQSDAEAVSLGSAINSTASELVDCVSPDGSMLVISRSDHPDNVGDKSKRDIWYTTKKADGSWAPLKNIGAPLNTSGHNFAVAVTQDLNTMFLQGIYNSDGSSTTSNGISESQRTATGWSMPKPLYIDDYYNDGDIINSHISPDGQVLILSVERNDARGGNDLYVCFRTTSGFTAPKNLGDVVNTIGTEMAPFIAADGRTLYFASNGHPGYEGRDLFVTVRQDDSWLNWSKPKNLGKPINSDEHDLFFQVPASGEVGYFSSTKNSVGSDDIFSIALPTEAKPKPVVLVRGRVLDAETRQPVVAQVVYEDLASNKRVGEAESSPTDGAYRVALPEGRLYGVHAEARGYYALSEQFDARDLENYKETERDLLLTPIKVNATFRLNNVFFDQGKYDLRAESFAELDRLVDFLKTNKSVAIELGGHTDNVGSDAANLQLSQDRVNSVMAYLVSKGTKDSRIKAKGYGESKPVATNDTDEGRQLNRRVEFTILKK